MAIGNSDDIGTTRDLINDGITPKVVDPGRAIPDEAIADFANSISVDFKDPVDTDSVDNSTTASPNVLHNYANWTYNISLYILTVEQYNSLTSSGNVSDDMKQNLLMRSGGAGGNSALQKDYYIDNLKFTSVVGPNSRSAQSGSNFNITFTITEPYGVAFLAELASLAESLGVVDQLDISYLLEIKFLGYDDDGKVASIPVAPKYIPIKIADMQFDVNSSSTVYNVTAVPYSHFVLQDKGLAYFTESFKPKGNTFEEIMSSMFVYLNSSETKRAEEQGRTPDTFEFIIHNDELAAAKVGFKMSTGGGGNNAVDTTDAAKSKPGFEQGDTGEAVTISANSLVKNTIEYIAHTTDFSAKYNTTGFPDSQGDNRPVMVIKVIPVVKEISSGYNAAAKRYPKKITYRIETHGIYGIERPHAADAPAETRGYVKDYKWIFTGENKDVLDVNLQYNYQYFNFYNNFQVAKGKVRGTVADSGDIQFDYNQDTRMKNMFAPAILPASSARAQAPGSNINRGASYQAAMDIMDNMLNNPGADMLQLDLQIIGDPDWIPQDKSILPVGTSESTSGHYDSHGSIAVDKTSVFVQLAFRTPRDYNESGTMNIDVNQTFVEGLYRVLTIESDFSGGRFTQHLTGVRVEKQVTETPSVTPTNNQERPTPQPQSMLAFNGTPASSSLRG